jgi:putative membrane protein
MNFITNFLKGVLIGVGNIAPGVSGGALAIVLGLYEDLIQSVNTFFQDIKKNFLFLLPIGMGAAAGVVGFSNVLHYLFDRHPLPTMFALAGLIVGMLPVFWNKANARGFKSYYLIVLLMALALSLYFSIVETGYNGSSPVEQLSITALLWCGFLVAGSIVIPGISGSVLLIHLGVYGAVLKAIATIDIPNLIPLALGLGVGVLVFSKLMGYLLKRYYSITYYAILGFIIGTIPELLKGISRDHSLVTGTICFIAGLLVSLFISMKTAR